VAARPTSRRVKETGHTRRLDELEAPVSEPSAPEAEPIGDPRAVARPSSTDPETREPEPIATDGPLQPLDPEASFRDLEARQTRWFEYREEWMRRKSAGKLEPPGDDAAPTTPSSP
jgi:hypothetical protein